LPLSDGLTLGGKPRIFPVFSHPRCGQRDSPNYSFRSPKSRNDPAARRPHPSITQQLTFPRKKTPKKRALRAGGAKELRFHLLLRAPLPSLTSASSPSLPLPKSFRHRPTGEKTPPLLFQLHPENSPPDTNFRATTSLENLIAVRSRPNRNRHPSARDATRRLSPQHWTSRCPSSGSNSFGLDQLPLAPPAGNARTIPWAPHLHGHFYSMKSPAKDGKGLFTRGASASRTTSLLPPRLPPAHLATRRPSIGKRGNHSPPPPGHGRQPAIPHHRRQSHANPRRSTKPPTETRPSGRPAQSHPCRPSRRARPALGPVLIINSNQPSARLRPRTRNRHLGGMRPAVKASHVHKLEGKNRPVSTRARFSPAGSEKPTWNTSTAIQSPWRSSSPAFESQDHGRLRGPANGPLFPSLPGLR